MKSAKADSKKLMDKGPQLVKENKEAWRRKRDSKRLETYQQITMYVRTFFGYRFKLSNFIKNRRLLGES